MLESIKNINGTELNENSEKLLNSMKKLRHVANDVIGTAPLKELKQGCYNLVINVGDDEYPVYYNATTVFAGGSPEITDDIYDEENYLGVTDDDEMMWFALTLQLAHQVDLLQEDNNKYSDELVAANEEMDKLNCKLAEEIKARQGYEESLKQLREELTAADNEIEGLEESLRASNKQCTEYVKDIDKLEVDNKRLSERVKTLVCEKCNGKDLPLKFGEQERGTPEDKVVRMDLETALMQQQIANLNTRIAQLEEKLHSTETELTTAMNANGILKTKIAALTDEKREAELLAYRLTRGEMHVQFDSMKSLEHENGVLKNENADLNQKLCQKVMHATYSAHGEEPEDDLKKKYDEVLDYNKKLRQEITALRIEAGKSVADSVLDSNAAEDNEDMQQTIAKETMADLTARINELESTLKDKDERINQLSKNNAALSTENKNFGDLLKEADRTARFYAREVDNLEKEIKDLKSEAAKSDEDNALEPHVVTANDDMKYTVSLETMNELTARIKELESINENLREENESLRKKLDAEISMINSVNSRNEELKTENDELRKDNEDFTSIAEAHLETTAKFADYKERQKRLYKHFKNLAEMIEDLMELG